MLFLILLFLLLLLLILLPLCRTGTEEIVAEQEDRVAVQEDSEDRVALQEESEDRVALQEDRVAEQEDGVAVQEDSGSESPWMWLVLGVVLAVLFGGCCWWFSRNPQDVREIISLQGC